MDKKSCVHDLSTINSLFVLPAQGRFTRREIRQAIGGQLNGWMLPFNHLLGAPST